MAFAGSSSVFPILPSFVANFFSCVRISSRKYSIFGSTSRLTPSSFSHSRATTRTSRPAMYCSTRILWSYLNAFSKQRTTSSSVFTRDTPKELSSRAGFTMKGTDQRVNTPKGELLLRWQHDDLEKLKE